MKLKRLLIFLLIILALALLSIYYSFIKSVLTGQSIANSPVEYPRETDFIVKVIDGDTVKGLSGNTYRLLGINTPEKKKPYYQEAKDFLAIEIENKSIELLRDGADKDKYERSLRYIFYENRLINVEILEKGLATSFMLEELKYRDKLANAEKFARQNEIGLWIKSKNICAGCIKLVELKPEEDYFIIKNDCDFNCNMNGWLVKDDANHFFELSDLSSGESRKYDSRKIFKLEVWNDNGDRFFMRDDKGNLVIFYGY